MKIERQAEDSQEPLPKKIFRSEENATEEYMDSFMVNPISVTSTVFAEVEVATSTTYSFDAVMAEVEGELNSLDLGNGTPSVDNDNQVAAVADNGKLKPSTRAPNNPRRCQGRERG